MIKWINLKVGDLKIKDKRILWNVVLSILLKGGTIVFSLALVKITFIDLNAYEFGFWMALTSVLTWFNYFDFGIGNGIRNDLTKGLVDGDFERLKVMLSTTYMVLLIVVLITSSVFVCLDYFDMLKGLFGESSTWLSKNEHLLTLLIICSLFQNYFRIVLFIYIADNRFYVNGLYGFTTQLASLMMMLFLHAMNALTIEYLILVQSFLPLFLIVVLNYIAFKGKYRNLTPQLFKIDRRIVPDVLRKGLMFFVLQFFWMLLTTTDLFLISYCFGELEVLDVSVFYRIFNLLPMVYFLVIGPFWTGFTEADYKGDISWVRKVIRRLNVLTLVFVLFGIFLNIILAPLLSFWLGINDDIDYFQSSLVLLQTTLIVYLFPFNYFLNGIGKIKIQTLSVVVGFVFKVLFIIILSKARLLSENWVLIVTSLSLLPTVFTSTYSVLKLTKRSETSELL